MFEWLIVSTEVMILLLLIFYNRQKFFIFFRSISANQPQQLRIGTLQLDPKAGGRTSFFGIV